MKKENENNKSLVERTKSYLNQNSKNVFIVMLCLIGISILISVYSAMTRKKESLKIENVTDEIKNNVSGEYQHLLNTHRLYEDLKEKESEVNAILAQDTITAKDSIRIKKIINDLRRR